MEKVLANDCIPFQTEGRLLQELGLRLVASPEVALVELIKNAYDADSPSCTVSLEREGHTLLVTDEGHGMTLSDFKKKWMRIATSSKTAQDRSAKFHRPLTGAKGIGRFAVRYLGDHLTLDSVAFDKSYDCLTRLKATFDWPKLDNAEDISKVEVDYFLTQASPKEQIGTKLIITKLRNSTDFARSSELRDSILRIISPLHGLDKGKFGHNKLQEEKDPGFKVVLPGEDNEKGVDLAKLVLDNYWGRLTVKLDKNDLTLMVWLPGQKKPKELEVKLPTHITSGLFADIRFFPRRAGVFSNKGINGRKAWSWVRANCGVKIVDHGFHVRPYGFEDDDWLMLDRDTAHNKRDWSTEIANKHFPLTKSEKMNPAENPVLNLASNYQVVGAVFIRSRRDLGATDEIDLVPAMDREGLLENDAFAELRHAVRAGLEFLAHEDKEETDRQAEKQAEEAAQNARKEIKEAIEYIQKSPGLTSGDKARLVKQYQLIADRVDEQEEYSAQARKSLLTMSLLGVVAGFMTHESKAVMHDLEQAVTQVNALAKKHSTLKTSATELSKRLSNFEGYLDYSRLFVRNVRNPAEQTLSAAGQIRYILNRFKAFADERKIAVTTDVSTTIKTPPLPVTVYSGDSGVLLNLYTNALKAVIVADASIKSPKVSIRSWNEGAKHFVDVADNGVGIPPQLVNRIWEPLYTTTSDVGNPLGSGMGLGLTLVKQVVNEFGGSINLLSSPPPGFRTCFRVMFPNKSKL